ncbi:RagB/SusD family nutrient uptake outer membrane protein [Fodinibius halophilus]|uniref:RagB/SusD family nutrient uptake outer membrane protein n=1 Tax=Fodinibius halophilus TaxID=1736908 RepID=A0A6M1T1Z3_9BACT|nr:RagB/SusD family nutrient uptake outer membrane protein [Fodinibius halophilus]NGP90078.1 RagB/SusD family nutrient uptake outer membrane protein [Fodinibius halophilus]
MKMLNRLILFSFILAFGIVSCDNITNINQPGNLPSEDALENVDDLELALPGLYSNLDVYDLVYFNSVRTDEIAPGPGNGGQGLGGQYQFVLNTTSAISATAWNSGYSSIDEINRFINSSSEIDPGDSEDLYNDLLGQAHAMRAFEYFKLTSLYSEDITDNSSMGVVVSTEVQDRKVKPTRNTTGETFSQILADIQKAENKIDPSLGPASNATRFTLPALTALKARIAAYRKNYERADSLSQVIIDNHALAGPADYQSMFGEDTQGEVLMKLERTLGDPYEGQAAIGTPAGSGFIGNIYAQVAFYRGVHYHVEQSLVDLYPGNDIRSRTNYFPDSGLPANLQNGPFNYVYKYSGGVEGEDTPLLNDQKLFRVSEMYLINAEAKAATGDLPGAAQRIFELRSARTFAAPGPSLPSYANQQEAFADILVERRKELAFEGHRWFDLRRMGPVAGVTIDRDETVTGIGGCNQYDACVGPDPAQDSEKYVLPIPQNELNANPNIKQNPGYGGGAGS